MRTRHKLAVSTFGAAAAMAFVAAPAFAADGSATANLSPVVLNGVNGSGTAMVKVSGTTISVTMAAQGVLANAPHAAHIHFDAAARNECPAARDDANKDGHINTTEGQPAYGDIDVSLTTSGDTSPKSGLAVDRFSTAPGGRIAYQRGSITIPADTAQAILAGKAVIVVHGVDYNHDGKYDGSVKSDLDPSLPTEATDPALCGVLRAAPKGGMATGEGGSTGGQNTGLVGLGVVALLGAAGLGGAALRRKVSNA